MMRRLGRLHVTGTPIGNLGDITFRAVEVLRECDVVAAEDTRRTRALLSHLDIHGKVLLSIEAHATDIAIGAVVRHLVEGRNVTLVTDAGTPAVSDPGAQLVRASLKAGAEVVVVPGPSAVTAAVALSGLVEGPFTFLGFLPRRGQKRRVAIARIVEAEEPVVLFEAPTRTADTLADLARAMPDREVAVCRELTKIHEEVVRGRLADVAGNERTWMGEVTIVLGPGTRPALEQVSDATLDDRIARMLAEGDSAREISVELAAWSRRPRREVYARVIDAQRKYKATLPGL